MVHHSFQFAINFGGPVLLAIAVWPLSKLASKALNRNVLNGVLKMNFIAFNYPIRVIQESLLDTTIASMFSIKAAWGVER